MPDNTPDPNYDPNSATIPMSGPRPSLSGSQVDLPLPEELAKLLPAGAYQVTDFLGAGGMGAVYKGTQIRLKRPVAIKIMRRDVGKDHDFEARFEREAQAMAKLNHPNIISVIDFGEAGPDYLFIVMELVDGTDLMEVIRSKQMTQEMVLGLLPQICDALQFAHDHGIVHRDIKPSNIMLTRDGRVKMADFGLAKHFDAVDSGFRTQTGTGMGTPDYAAPEQFDSTTPIDHRADIYALGVMIYQMITGALPRGVWRPPSQRAEVAPQWDNVVSRAMQNDPADRYQKASEVKTDVSSIPLAGRNTAILVRDQTHGGTAAKSKDTNKKVRATTKSRAPLLFGLIVGAIVIATGAFFALRDTGEGRAAAPSAAASAPTTTTAAKAPATPTAALAGTSALPAAATPAPIAAPALPESGWKPLFTETEWHLTHKTTRKQVDGSTVPAGRVFENGLLHVQNNGFLKPQPATDAAIRARIVIQQGSGDTLAIVARRSVADGFYRWGTTTNDRLLVLTHFQPGTNSSTHFGKHELPAPLRPGGKLELELRVQGNRLIALANGVAVIEARDDRLKAAGECGIDAHDAWFESVEVQPLPAAAVSPAPNLPVSKSSATTATKDAPFTNTLGMKFVPVPITGGPTDKQRMLFSVWETRVQDYEVFAKETMIAWAMPDFEQGPTHPAVKVSWDAATAFCAWLTERDRKAGKLAANEVYRLPTDHEWSCAADFGKREQPERKPQAKNQGYPDDMFWGRGWPPPAGVANYAGQEAVGKLAGQTLFIEGWSDSFVHTAPVGSFPSSPLGLFDLAGNVWEFVQEFYDVDAPPEKRRRATRGGGFSTAKQPEVRIACRGMLRQDAAVDYLGFRIVIAPATAEPTGAAAEEESLRRILQRNYWMWSDDAKRAAGPIRLPPDGQVVKPRQLSFLAGWELVDARRFKLSQTSDKYWIFEMDAGMKEARSTQDGTIKVLKILTAVPADTWEAPTEVLTYGGHRYQAYFGALSWAEARTKAEAMGGHLATITSKEESEWVKKSFGARFIGIGWDSIALGGVCEGGTWKWITGEPFTYTDWHANEPSGGGKPSTLQYWNQDGRIACDDLINDSRAVRSYLVEWDDAGASASSSPNLPVSKSSDPKFPPGQWVKLFTKPEDLPADLRKPGSGVTWEDGWVRGLKAGQVLTLPESLLGNYAIRLRSTAQGEAKSEVGGEGIVVRRQEPDKQAKRGHYQAKLGGGKFLIQQMVGGNYQTLHTSVPPDAPLQGQNYTLEAGVIGNRLVGRLNSNSATVVMAAEFRRGKAYLGFITPIRDIEVINLDGLPEAAALRLLGVDEQGKDLRGKGGAAK